LNFDGLYKEGSIWLKTIENYGTTYCELRKKLPSHAHHLFLELLKHL
jgi:hypothetical protein